MKTSSVVYYLSLPFLAIILVVLQTVMADILFAGLLFLEISLIAVIYAGLRLDLVQGMISSFVLGFVLDCMAGSVLGLFTFAYSLIFLCSFFISGRMDTGKLYFIGLFSLICALLEGLFVIIVLKLVYGLDMTNVPYLFIIQALIVSVFSMLFFYGMRRVEGFFYGTTMQSAQRARAVRISTEA